MVVEDVNHTKGVLLRQRWTRDRGRIFLFFIAYSYALTQISDLYVGPTPHHLLTTYSA